MPKHIGLRERVQDALDRASYCDQSVSEKTHVLLRVEFTPRGLAHYGTASAGAERFFSPFLAKRVYSDKSYDWKVWHFLDELPFLEFNEYLRTD